MKWITTIEIMWQWLKNLLKRKTAIEDFVPPKPLRTVEVVGTFIVGGKIKPLPIDDDDDDYSPPNCRRCK